MAHAHIDPVGCLITAHIVVAKEYGARIVVTIAQHVAAERALAHSACCLNKIKTTLLEDGFALPYVRVDVGSVGEDMGQYILEYNSFHCY